MYNYDLEKDDWEDAYEADDRVDELYDRHRDALAHLPKEIYNQVSHLPTAQATVLGGELLKVERQADANRKIVESIWGKSSEKVN